MAIAPTWLRVPLVATGLLSTSCGWFGATPVPPTFQGTFAPPACDPPEGRASFFIVDADATDRAELAAVAIRNRGVVVAYDCKTMRVLRHCSTSATYDFVGTSPKTGVHVFQSAIDVGADLPLHGSQVIPRIAAAYGQSSLIGADITVVGEYALDRAGKNRAALYGTDECREATHVLDTMSVGAFAIGAVATNGGGANVQIGPAGAGASGSALARVFHSDGDRTKCVDSTDATDAPAQCRVPVKLSLVPLVGDLIPPQLDPPACPAGLVRQERSQSCTLPVRGVPHTCRADANDCELQCNLGDAPSCNQLGYMFESGWIVGTVDLGRATTLYDRACSAGYLRACKNRADLLVRSKVASSVEICQLYSKACSSPIDSDGAACTGKLDYCPKAPGSLADVAAMGLRTLSLPGLPAGMALPGAPTPGADPLLVRACKARDRVACDRLRAAGVRR